MKRAQAERIYSADIEYVGVAIRLSGSEQIDRRLEWEACLNARDVGGYPTDKGGRTRWRALIRSDTLHRLTDAGRAALVNYGVNTIIDLRYHSELEVAPNPFARATGKDGAPLYRHFPEGYLPARVWQSELSAAPTHAEMNRVVLDHAAPQLAAIVRAVADAPEGGVVVHCHAGKDRTGRVIALLMALAGVPDKIIAEDYALSELYLKERYDAELRDFSGSAIEKARAAELMRSNPATILDTLSYLRSAYGGADAYCRAAGVSETDLQRVRERLCQ